MINEYIEVFRVEAKSLLKNFRNNDKNVALRVQKVFGARDDLSLMNMQHVVAREYGFTNWNELAAADETRLVDALVNTKSATFITPFRAYGGGRSAGEVEKIKYKPMPERKGVDLVNFKEISANGYESEWLPLENMDLSGYDLRRMDVKYASFDERTVWSEDKTKLPAGFEPRAFMEKRKNPGLGVRDLHKQGIDGRGRAAAIIDFQVLRHHLEYLNNIKGYEEIAVADDLYTSAGGGLVSALAGRTCGVAPKADVYYYSVGTHGRSQRYYAEALNKVCDLHEKLISEGKSGIDTVCILNALLSPARQADDGAQEMREAAQRAKALGIWVNCGYWFLENRWRMDMRIFCEVNGDVDNADDYVLMPNTPAHPAEHKDLAKNELCFPAGGRTVAVDGKLNAYEFSAPGFYLKPYQCGLFMLARSVKDDLTADEFAKLCLKTGDYREGMGVIVNPKRLIDTLKGIK